MTRARSPASQHAIVVTSASIHVPGPRLTSLLGDPPDEASCPPEQAHVLLGQKGLLNKEPSTRLALCAVHRALDLPPRVPRADRTLSPRTAVVAASNFGNVATVLTVVRTLHDTGLKDVSALDAPNASSNVLASAVAMWFRFGGPNLMVCSGATAGLDAVHLGCTLLRADRADRVVVVGAEPGDDVAVGLHARRVSAEKAALLAGAAAVVLERVDSVDTDRPRLESWHDVAWSGACGGTDVSVVIGPAGRASRSCRTIDIVRDAGDPYGALGVVQLALASRLLRRSPPDGPQRIVVTCGDEADGWRSLVVRG